MAKKEIGEISIKELAEEADINRKTFYAHYTDVYAVFDEIENDLILKILGIIDNADILANQYNPFPLFRELTDEINRDPDYYKYLVASTTYGRLEKKIKKVVHSHLFEIHGGALPANPEVLAYVLDFIAAGIASVYREWFNSEKAMPLEALSRVVSMLVSDGINAILAQDRS